MDVRHLDLLRELADRGTLTAVATATHRTPSAVSQQLRAAEREAGMPLVEPHGRGVRLTRAGLLLSEGAVDVATALARVRAQLDTLRDAPVGTVTIGALPSAAEVLVPELLARLEGSGLLVTLDDFDVAESDFARLAADHDIVIGHTITGDAPEGSAHLHHRTLAEEPLDVALPVDHHLARRRHLTPELVVGERWVGVPEGYPFDTVLVAMENATGRRIERIQRLRDNRVVEAMVAHGLGIALLPRFTTRPRAGVVSKPLVGVRAARRIVALSRRDVAQRVAVRSVLDLLADIGARASR
ncbi:LysR family transcriptional regulator [Phycicoccus sp. Root101]|uniref:LysR family transcriptional regulator n=1 Tax=Phycicoccus sp. Root101 TaxID=1736421 RepID=UPI000702C7F4|nr:LysR family transcriptional regulator [Phycicoccus sp. Root101]KQU70875.1 transcriptional regulator [Phycicoccus sp. Root101]